MQRHSSIFYRRTIYCSMTYEREGDGMKKDSPRYRMAARLLPHRMYAAAMQCADELRGAAEEFRLRRGQLPSILGAKGETVFFNEAVEEHDLQAILDRATEFSVYRSADSIRRGFVTIEGGCRVGLCGRVVWRDGEIATLREISSVSIRIVKEMKGIADALYPQLWAGDRFQSTLIVSPPGGGKTTLLRDLIRLVSCGDAAHLPLRTAVVDERCEIAAVCRGAAQFDMGLHTDILSAAPKDEGILMLLRAMNPQVIAVDEITDPSDLRAMEQAANCGVEFLATVHGYDMEELRRRSVCRALLDKGLFHRFLVVERRMGERSYRVESC